MSEKIEGAGLSYALLPILWILAIYIIIKKKVCLLILKREPKVTSFIFEVSETMNSIRVNAATAHALDIVYNHHNYRKIVEFIFLRILNAKAVRNRARVVTSLLLGEIEQQSENNNPVRILSIACGSAQPLLDAVYKAKQRNPKLSITLVMTDIDRKILRKCRERAESLNISIETKLCHVDKITDINSQFEIIEILGLLDYMSDTKTVEIFDNIKNLLTPNGKIFTCNIRPNPEIAFMEEVMEWKMLYRSPKGLKKLGERVFKNVTILEIPLKIHTVMVLSQKHETPAKVLDI